MSAAEAEAAGTWAGAARCFSPHTLPGASYQQKFDPPVAISAMSSSIEEWLAPIHDRAGVATTDGEQALTVLARGTQQSRHGLHELL